MSRYTGPAFRKSRRLGFSTLENELLHLDNMVLVERN